MGLLQLVRLHCNLERSLGKRSYFQVDFFFFPREGWILKWAKLAENYINWEFNYLRSSVDQSCVSFYQGSKWGLLGPESRRSVSGALTCVYSVNSSHCGDHLFLPVLSISASTAKLVQGVFSCCNPNYPGTSLVISDMCTYDFSVNSYF